MFDSINANKLNHSSCDMFHQNFSKRDNRKLGGVEWVNEKVCS